MGTPQPSHVSPEIPVRPFSPLPPKRVSEAERRLVSPESNGPRVCAATRETCRTRRGLLGLYNANSSPSPPRAWASVWPLILNKQIQKTQTFRPNCGRDQNLIGTRGGELLVFVWHLGPATLRHRGLSRQHAPTHTQQGATTTTTTTTTNKDDNNDENEDEGPPGNQRKRRKPRAGGTPVSTTALARLCCDFVFLI